VNGVPLPKEYVKELVKKGKLKPEEERCVASSSSGYGCDVDPYLKEGAWAVNDRLYLWIVESEDCNEPYEAYLQDTINAYARFYQFGVDRLYYYKFYEYWDWKTCDVYPYWDTLKLLDDLYEDTNWVRYEFNDKNHKNDIVIGWVDMGDHNGIAYCNHYFSIAATRTLSGVNWPHDSIAQHEISHNFNAGEGGTWCWEHPECIMNYCWAKLGTDIWCENHWCVVYGNVNGVWEDCLI
jgi:hypothetical protein